MLGYRALRIQKSLQDFDENLFLNQNYLGELQVMRMSYRYVTYEYEGETILNLERHPQYVMSLTEDWTSRTKPVDWGILPILNRLREIDSYNPESFVNRFEEIEAKRKQTKDRELMNETEAFAKEFRPQFAKAFDGINTSTLEKVDSRRKREKLYGNR